MVEVRLIRRVAVILVSFAVGCDSCDPDDWDATRCQPTCPADQVCFKGQCIRRDGSTAADVRTEGVQAADTVPHRERTADGPSGQDGPSKDAPLIDTIAKKDAAKDAIAKKDAAKDATPKKDVAKKPNGVACGSASECSSAHCVDGVCCNTTCVGACRGCKVTGSIGTCTFYATGDPDNNCGNYNCNPNTGTCRTACTVIPGCDDGPTGACKENAFCDYQYHCQPDMALGQACGWNGVGMACRCLSGNCPAPNHVCK